MRRKECLSLKARNVSCGCGAGGPGKRRAGSQQRETESEENKPHLGRDAEEGGGRAPSTEAQRAEPSPPGASKAGGDSDLNQVCGLEPNQQAQGLGRERRPCEHSGCGLSVTTGHISESAANVVGPLDLDLGTTDDNREEELAKNSSAPRPSLSTLCASCPGPPACACRVPSPQGSRGTHVPTSQLSL
ncbi:hypothetical protein CB1_000707030 [Camelus ferus]|nr:hypothetical protein CB1_000707030 [Camelus ferus]